MGHAAGAVHLVHGAHPVPDHMHSRGGTVVGLDDHGQAVGQLVLLHTPRALRHGYCVAQAHQPEGTKY